MSFSGRSDSSFAKKFIKTVIIIISLSRLKISPNERKREPWVSNSSSYEDHFLFLVCTCSRAPFNLWWSRYSMRRCTIWRFHHLAKNTQLSSCLMSELTNVWPPGSNCGSFLILTDAAKWLLVSNWVSNRLELWSFGAFESVATYKSVWALAWALS